MPKSTLFIVRHAEKDFSKTEFPLSEPGLQRALALRDKLAAIQFKSLWATPYLRTQQTLAPLAKAQNLAVQTYTINKGPALCRRLSVERNNIVLIAAHSNTISDLVSAFSLTMPFLVDETRYGDLFIIQIESGRATLQLDRFGL